MDLGCKGELFVILLYSILYMTFKVVTVFYLSSGGCKHIVFKVHIFQRSSCFLSSLQERVITLCFTSVTSEKCIISLAMYLTFLYSFPMSASS